MRVSRIVRYQKGRILKAAILGVLAAAAALVLNPFQVIGTGHRGVVTNFGRVQPEVWGEGMHLRVPILQTVHEVSVQIQKVEAEGDAASKDLQSVHSTIALNFHFIPDRITDTFQSLGDLGSVGDRIIVPAMQEALKATTARYTAEELISKRADVRDQINNAIRERMIRRGIAVDEFSIVNFRFSDSFNQAIDARMAAEQLKLKAERDLQRIEVEARQKVAAAKAEAEALALQRKQVTPDLIRLREVENQRLALQKWDGRGAAPSIHVGK